MGTFVDFSAGRGKNAKRILPKGAGASADAMREQAAEIGGIGESDRRADFRDGAGRGGEQTLGRLHP
jgi:hypothetical protein